MSVFLRRLGAAWAGRRAYGASRLGFQAVKLTHAFPPGIASGHPSNRETPGVAFSSPSFLFVFLPLTLAVYFSVSGMPVRNLVLLVLSLAFYAWGEPVMVLAMLGSIGFNYAAARCIDRRAGRARTWVLALAISANLAALGVFKYAVFATDTARPVLAGLGLPPPAPVKIALPLGISFYTFHALSYLIDVYRGRFAANRRLPEVALYIAFFPQLIAGPIVRYRMIARRLAARRHSWGRASAGLRMLVIGLAMKVLIADSLAPLANAAFDHAAAPGILAAWIGALAYTLQIYFDFAGYSTMAVGMGVVFGFSLPRNFDYPYRSRSITEFWRRWHMTLSAWFRDYLYIPLGGNRGGPVRTYRNLIVVFLLCGLWHGANWTFVAWGLWHGLFLVLERAGLDRILARAPTPLACGYALVVVVLGWVLFRSPTFAVAMSIWRGMAGLNGASASMGPELARVWTGGQGALMAGALVLSVVGPPRIGAPPFWTPVAGLVRGVVVAALLALCILAVAGDGYSPFLYYRF